MLSPEKYFCHFGVYFKTLGLQAIAYRPNYVKLSSSLKILIKEL